MAWSLSARVRVEVPLFTARAKVEVPLPACSSSWCLDSGRGRGRRDGRSPCCGNNSSLKNSLNNKQTAQVWINEIKFALRVTKCIVLSKKSITVQWSSKRNTFRPQIPELSEDPPELWLPLSCAIYREGLLLTKGCRWRHPQRRGRCSRCR